MALVAVDVCPAEDAWGDVCWEERPAVGTLGVQSVVAMGVVLGMLILALVVVVAGPGKWCPTRIVVEGQPGLG